MKNYIKSKEKGQALVLFVLGLLALIAISALVIDGGNMYLNRRAAQTAADAGALAGAYELCSGGGATEAITTAIQYATVENGATSATANIVDGDVVVDAYIDQKSFFAQVLGINQIQVPATASANCFPPNVVDRVLPVAWTCKPPDVGTPSDSEDCQIESLAWYTEMEPFIYGPFPFYVDGETYPITQAVNLTNNNKNGPILQNHLYVMMDTNKVDEDLAKVCAPPIGTGTMNCDIDADGISDVLGGGDRSWLYLDYDVNNIKKIISGQISVQVEIHKWLPGKPGSDKASFDAVIKRVEDCLADPDTDTNAERDDCRVFVLPVYNQVCPKGADPSICEADAHNPPNIPLEPGETDITPPGGFNNGSTYFHIIGFSEIYITCIHKSGQINCPGEKAANIDKNIGTLEGYFIRGYPVDASGSGGTGGADLGMSLIRSLTK
jgi:hypothetical protein